MQDQVLNVLKESQEPLKAGEIATKLGVDKSEVDKTIKVLKKEDKIVSPKRCYYASK